MNGDKINSLCIQLPCSSLRFCVCFQNRICFSWWIGSLKIHFCELLEWKVIFLAVLKMRFKNPITSMNIMERYCGKTKGWLWQNEGLFVAKRRLVVVNEGLVCGKTKAGVWGVLKLNWVKLCSTCFLKDLFPDWYQFNNNVVSLNTGLSPDDPIEGRVIGNWWETGREIGTNRRRLTAQDRFPYNSQCFCWTHTLLYFFTVWSWKHPIVV